MLYYFLKSLKSLIKMKKIIYALLFLITLIQAQDDLYDEIRIYNVIIALKGKNPEDTPWTNSNTYNQGVSVAIGFGYGGYTEGGCVAFVMIASDAAFGNIPSFQKNDKEGIKVGDIVRINNDTYSVIILKKL